MHWKKGQTLGKMAMSIKVVDVSENRNISLRQAVLRDSVPLCLQVALLFFIMINMIDLQEFTNEAIEPFNTYLGSVVFLWFIAEVFSMGFNAKRRAVYDFMAKTTVVDTIVHPFEN